jgi:hypothetical protein
MTINGFFSKLKSNGANQTPKGCPEVLILKQRLSELGTQWSISGGGEDEAKENPSERRL